MTILFISLAAVIIIVSVAFCFWNYIVYALIFSVVSGGGGGTRPTEYTPKVVDVAPTNPLTSCYIPGDTSVCTTCDDVAKAYVKKNLTFDVNKFPQCNKTPAGTVTNCYGAGPPEGTDNCKTCGDVVQAYNSKNWVVDVNKFAQCN